MEEKLEKYRANLRRREKLEKIKQSLIRMVTFAPRTDAKKEEHIEISEEMVNEEEPSSGSEITEQPEIWSSEEETENTQPAAVTNPSDESSKLKYIIYILWFCFWATCWMIAIEFQFGIVYLMFSALFGVYFNTRTGPKLKNEVSAYSVFNKNCESIKGSLKAEQFENEIRYGPMAVQR